MKPSLGAPFDASRVWEREDVETSLRVAKTYREYFVRHLENVLKNSVGKAHLEMATKGEHATKIQTVSEVETVSSSIWRQLHDEFMNLVTEERKHRAPPLIASFLPQPDDKPGVVWMIHQSPTQKIQADFELLATRAGRTLGQAPDTVDGPLNHWLNALRGDLSNNRSKWLRRFKVSMVSGPEKDAWCIEFVSEASAVFCRRLEKAALEAVGQVAGSKAPGRKREPVPHTRTTTQHKTAAEATGERRAKLTGRLITELNALRLLIQVPDDDFPRLSNENPNYETFKICKKHPSASQYVKFLPDRKSVHSLAYQIAAIECHCSAATIQTAWKRFKPRQKK
jgi:hypothetical protein